MVILNGNFETMNYTGSVLGLVDFSRRINNFFLTEKEIEKFIELNQEFVMQSGFVVALFLDLSNIYLFYNYKGELKSEIVNQESSSNLVINKLIIKSYRSSDKDIVDIQLAGC